MVFSDLCVIPTVPWVGMQCVIEALLGHSKLTFEKLFFLAGLKSATNLFTGESQGDRTPSVFFTIIEP